MLASRYGSYHATQALRACGVLLGAHVQAPSSLHASSSRSCSRPSSSLSSSSSSSLSTSSTGGAAGRGSGRQEQAAFGASSCDVAAAWPAGSEQQHQHLQRPQRHGRGVAGQVRFGFPPSASLRADRPAAPPSPDWCALFHIVCMYAYSSVCVSACTSSCALGAHGQAHHARTQPRLGRALAPALVRARTHTHAHTHTHTHTHTHSTAQHSTAQHTPIAAPSSQPSMCGTARRFRAHAACHTTPCNDAGRLAARRQPFRRQQ